MVYKLIKTIYKLAPCGYNKHIVHNNIRMPHTALHARALAGVQLDIHTHMVAHMHIVAPYTYGGTICILRHHIRMLSPYAYVEPYGQHMC